MKSALLVGLVATLAGAVGCAGKYEHGGDQRAVGGSSGADAVSVGGSTSAAASSAGAPATSFCGVQFSSRLPESALVGPAEVAARVQTFLGTDVGAPTSLPEATTRDWAASLVTAAFRTAGGYVPFKGITRFTTSFWPNTTYAEQYASLFNNDELVTLIEGEPKGSPGLLYDPSMLSQPTISARGGYIATNLLCIPIPPGDGGPGLMVPPNMTRRQTLEQAMTSPSCTACHRLIDPLGDGLEHYADDGSYRYTDNGLQIDSSGKYDLKTTGTITFTDDKQLARELVNSCEVAQCFAQRMMQDALSLFPDTTAPDPGEVARVAADFSASRGELAVLVRGVASSDAFLMNYGAR